MDVFSFKKKNKIWNTQENMKELNDPRDIAIRYYSRMKTEAEAAYNFVILLQRTNRKKCATKEDAYKAVKDEIDIEGNKCAEWVLYYKRGSRLLDIYNSPAEEVKQICEDIERCLKVIDKILRSADTTQSLSDQLIILEQIFSNCIAIAERELEKLGVQGR